MNTETHKWFVYMLRCGDGSLYTGITTDVARRLAEHGGAAGNNKGAKSLRGKQPLTVAQQFSCADRSAASQLEYRIKQLSKVKKEALVAGQMTVEELAGVAQ